MMYLKIQNIDLTEEKNAKRKRKKNTLIES